MLHKVQKLNIDENNNPYFILINSPQQTPSLAPAYKNNYNYQF